MGCRANYVIRDANGWRLYYSHWGGQRIDADFFWGPEHAIRFVERQARCGPDEWLNDQWAEGGAMIDRVHRRLLLFGVLEYDFVVPMLRAKLALIRANWPGWSVQWAHEGLGDIVDALGLPRTLVRSELPWKDRSPDPAREDDWNDTLLSVRGLDGALRIHPTATWIDQVVMCGPKLVARVREFPSRVPFRFTTFPLGGAHIDESWRTIGFWSSQEQQDLAADLKELWEGWTVIPWWDGYEHHLEIVGGVVEVPHYDRADLLRDAAAAIRGNVVDDIVERIGSLVGVLTNEGKDVQAAPALLQHQAVSPTLDEEARERVLAAAMKTALAEGT